jgi:CRISPR/Cas system CSM-associated protein Csm3 (group 7 of RAMP superfamily)
LLLEADNPETLQQYQDELAAVFHLAELGHLPLGGNQWRGLGWVSWQFDDWQDGHYGDPLPLEANDDQAA